MHQPTEEELEDIFRPFDENDIAICLEECINDRQVLNKIFNYLTILQRNYENKTIFFEDYHNVTEKILKGIIKYRRHP